MSRLAGDERHAIRVAYGSVPKDSGTFTFYRNLRPALLRHGIDLRCVTVGEGQSRLVETGFVDDGCVMIGPGLRNPREQARAFADWCDAERIDIVMAINSAPVLSALPHLSERIRVVARCANGFDEGYRVTLAGRDRLARIVALVPRLRDDLVADHGAEADRIVLIPNGIAPAPFDEPAALSRGTGAVLEIAFLGRIEHKQKGVLHLPGIADALVARGVPFRMRIGGKGKHERALRQALAGHIAEGRVAMSGSVGPSDVPAFLGAADVFAFTSHFEGCPNALLEAMMAGAVPVSWELRGITDFLIDHGRTGFLCRVGDVRAFAEHVGVLAAHRARLAAMSRTVAAEARRRYSSGISARAYAELFAAVMAEPPPRWQPRPWHDFRPDPSFRTGWRSRLSPRQKGLARAIFNWLPGRPHWPSPIDSADPKL